MLTASEGSSGSSGSEGSSGGLGIAGSPGREGVGRSGKVHRLMAHGFSFTDLEEIGGTTMIAGDGPVAPPGAGCT